MTSPYCWRYYQPQLQDILKISLPSYWLASMQAAQGEPSPTVLLGCGPCGATAASRQARGTQWNDSGMTALGETKSFLIRFKVCFLGGNSHLILYSGHGPQWGDHSRFCKWMWCACRTAFYTCVTAPQVTAAATLSWSWKEIHIFTVGGCTENIPN